MYALAALVKWRSKNLSWTRIPYDTVCNQVEEGSKQNVVKLCSEPTREVLEMRWTTGVIWEAGRGIAKQFGVFFDETS